MRTTSLVTMSLALALAVGCGGQSPAKTGGAEPAPTATPEPAPTAAPEAKPEAKPEAAPEPKAWADLNKEERIAFMKNNVMPKMTELFQGFDPKEFEKVTCKTCHGEKAEKGDFHMPNDKLPKLDPKNSFAKHKKDQKMVDFMMQKVTPEMASFLGKPVFDPKTGQGFGCGGCHPMAGM